MMHDNRSPTGPGRLREMAPVRGYPGRRPRRRHDDEEDAGPEETKDRPRSARIGWPLIPPMSAASMWFL